MFVEIFTFCFDSRVMHFMFDLTHFKKNTKQTSNIWSVKVDFLSDSVKRGILRYSFKVLNAVFAFVCHKWDNRNVIMMCFLAAGLVWLLAGLCHALGINTQVGAAVTEAEMLGFSPLCISAHNHPVREAEVDATVNFHKNNQLRVHCITNEEQFHYMRGLSEETCGASTCTITLHLSRANCPGSTGNLCCN